MNDDIDDAEDDPENGYPIQIRKEYLQEEQISAGCHIRNLIDLMSRLILTSAVVLMISASSMGTIA